MKLTGYVLDSSAMLGFAAGRVRYRGLVRAALEDMVTLALPTAALAVAWARASRSEQDALQELIDFPVTTIDVLGLGESVGAGLLLAEAGKPEVVATGHVIWMARQIGRAHV